MNLFKQLRELDEKFGKVPRKIHKVEYFILLF